MTQHGTPSQTAVSFFDNGIALSNAMPAGPVWPARRKTLPPEKMTQNGKETVKFFRPFLVACSQSFFAFFRSIQGQIPLSGVLLSTAAKTLPPPQNGGKTVKFFHSMLGHLRLRIFRVIRAFRVRIQLHSRSRKLYRRLQTVKKTVKFFSTILPIVNRQSFDSQPGRWKNFKIGHLWSRKVIFGHLFSGIGPTRTENG